jgi:hypothetical protein
MIGGRAGGGRNPSLGKPADPEKLLFCGMWVEGKVRPETLGAKSQKNREKSNVSKAKPSRGILKG